MSDSDKVPVSTFQNYVLSCVEAGSTRLTHIRERIEKDGSARCMLHAHMNGNGFTRSADRVIDRALQYLRKAELIKYNSKAGWTIR